MVVNFNDFQESRLNESENYQIPGVKSTWDGGYVIYPLDITVDEIDEIPRDRIIIPKQNETSFAICYMDGDGDESDYLWIPKEACKIKSNDSGSITEISFDPYKKWLSAETNKGRIEDFIEEFADSVESTKTTGQEKIKRNAQDDVELLMDIMEIPGTVESFDSCGDYIWDAKLNNGMLIEITKRSPDDLLSKFKIYLKANDHYPCIYINNNSGDRKTLFRIPSLDNEVAVPKGLLGSGNLDHYTKYLTKRAMEIQDSSDEEDLLKYFQDQISQESDDKETLKIISDLLSEFMDRREVEALSPKLHSNS
jgi:hypothetical protein